MLQGYEKRGLLTLLSHAGREKKGQSASINKGIKKSKSEYISILDSDDLFAHDKIKKQVTYLQRYPHIGLVYGNGKAIDENSQELYTIHDVEHVENNDPNMLLLDCYFLLPKNSLVRASVYARIGGG